MFFKSKLKGEDVLLTASVLFIGYINVWVVVCICILTWITFFAQKHKTKAWWAIVLQLTVLILVHYNALANKWLLLGMSYYGLQNIGVLLQAIRKPTNTYFSFRQLLLANVFFPKFTAGPILLPQEIGQLQINKAFIPTNFHQGLNRIVFGLFKKLVLADQLAVMTQNIFEHPSSEFKAPTIVIATLLFTLEMYLNFSAYTDIAIGFAKWFNLKLKENFKLPMRSTSVSEYWRKTHISLIDWFTQNFFYYITFTWRKKPFASTLIGIAVTFFLSGIWHGLYAGFVIWGALNACYLIIEFVAKKYKLKLPKILGWLIMFVAVSFANLFFNARYLSNSLRYLKQIFNTSNWTVKWDVDVLAILANGGYLEQQFRVLVLSIFVFVFFMFEKKLEALAQSTKISVLYLLIFSLLIFVFGNFNSGSQFIYIQF